nr:endonuclease domain-containing protein [uncultured Devosia sp.]
MRSPDFIRERAKTARRGMTGPERVLWALLRRNQRGLHFRRQHPIGPFILDFYCATARLCVEIDGPSHDDRADYDQRRTAWLGREGIRVLRFTVDEVELRSAVVLDAIVQAAPPFHRLTAVPLPRRRGRIPD